MTCKDCLYYEHCHSQIAYGMGSDDLTGKYYTDIESRCKSFKSKADFVEVVRCKDCLYNEYGSCEHSMNYPLNTNYCPDFYCAKGLRVRRCRE